MKHKGIYIALFVVVVLVVLYFLMKSKKQATPAAQPTSVAVTLLTKMLGHVPTGAELNCNPYNPGYNNNGLIDGFCGNPAPQTPCDPNRPGFDINGFLSTNCGA